MGKYGPCFHCGISSSPLWRNGPPSKPVLCNACGSRWRTKGTLANYRPLHAKLLQGPDALDDKLPPFHISTAYHVQRHFENSLGVPIKSNVDVGVKSNAKQYVYYKGVKRGTVGYKSPSGGTVSNKAPSGGIVSNKAPSDGIVSNKAPSGGTVINKAPSGGIVSNKSPSGSAISISESDNHSESSEGNDVPDLPQKRPPQKQIWEMQIPSKKRTKVTHELISVSPMESFRREMLKLYQQQLLELAELSKSSENIFVERQSVSIYSETALGACLLKPPGDSNAVPEPSSHVIIDNEKPCFNGTSSLIEGTGDANKMKAEPAKENTLTTKSLVSASISLPDVYINGNVSQPSTTGSLISSHTSRFIGSRFSELVNQKHPPDYKGIVEKLSDADREWKMNFEYDFST